MTLSITRLVIMTISINGIFATLGIVTLSTMTYSIMKLSKMTPA